MQHEQPTLLDYETRQPPGAWWPFLRIALIGWAAIGVFQFLAGLAGFGYQRRGLLLVPSVLEFIGCASLLLGAISAFASNSRNTALTIGAGSLGLYVALSTWFGGSVRSGSYLPAFLNSVQHVWFPIALVVLKIRSPGQSAAQAPLAQMGSPLQLLLAAQLPGVAGMCLVGAMFAGLIGSDPFGATVMVILILTVGASILSAALSLAFVRSPHRVLARRLAIAHVVYLVGLVATCAVMIATSKPRYHGPGGF
jgi:hypothetical protein